MIRNKVSLIVPIYNAESYLTRCLDSLINQTLAELEIILINDGSTDKSLQICKDYKEKDERIVLIDKENEGTSKTRNRGLDKATGEYICFVDADDYVELNAFEEMYNIAKETDAAIVLFNHFNGDGTINNVKFPKNKLLKGEEKNNVLKTANTDFFIPFSWRNIFKNTEKQKEIKFKTNLKFGEDSLYNLESYLIADSLYCSKEAFYHYQFNPHSTMSNRKKDFLKYLENLYDEKIKLYEKMGLDNFKIDLYNYTLSHTLNLLICDVRAYENPTSYNKAFCQIGKSHMIRESFRNGTISIERTTMSYINKKIAKSIKNEKYSMILVSLTINKFCYAIFLLFEKIKQKLLK